MTPNKPLVVGSQYRFLGTITKNREVWNLTGATVLLYFKRSDGTSFSQSATAVNASSAQFKYENSTSDLNMEGQWTRYWHIVDSSGGVYKTVPIQFTVVAAP